MGNFFELIRNRRSIRNYDPDKKVNDEILNKILKAGRIAPSAANRQPWKFIVVKNLHVRQKVNQSYQRGWFHDAPLVLAVIGYPNLAWVRRDGYNSIQVDLTIAMDHMILAAEAEGVGTCWISGFDEKRLKEALNLDTNEVVYFITPLGYPRDGYVKERGPIRKDISAIVEVR